MDEDANLRVQDVAGDLGAMQTDGGMCGGRESGKNKGRIDGKGYKSGRPFVKWSWSVCLSD